MLTLLELYGLLKTLSEASWHRLSVINNSVFLKVLGWHTQPAQCWVIVPLMLFPGALVVPESSACFFNLIISVSTHLGQRTSTLLDSYHLVKLSALLVDNVDLRRSLFLILTKVYVIRVCNIYIDAFLLGRFHFLSITFIRVVRVVPLAEVGVKFVQRALTAGSLVFSAELSKRS